MLKKMFLLVVVFCAAGLVSAVTLSDSTLQGFVDFGWNSNTLNAINDIAGDPGTAYNVTLTGEGWTDIAIGAYNSGGLSAGDQWEIAIHNPDAYQTYIQLFLQVDGWVYTIDSDSAEGWVAAGATSTLVFDIDAGITNIDAVGIKIGTDSWTERPSGSTFDVNIVPDPATMILLGLGGLAVRRRRH